MKKIKKKIKLKSILVLLGIIIFIAVLVYLFLNIRIKNIYVRGINFIKEKDIITINNLYNYPKILDFNKNDFIKKVKENPLVNDIQVSVSFFGKVVIDIDENIPICRKNNKIILSNGKIEDIDITKELPILTNEIDEDVYNEFIKKIVLIDKSIMSKISEIEYSPSTIDKEKFLFLMNDGNMVYITLSKIDLVNNYNEIYPTLDGKKGILHLDSGNHFEIKE